VRVRPSIARIAVALLLAGCVGYDRDQAPAEVELTVLAAASLRDALAVAAPAYEAARPGTRLVISTDSSAALATQVEQGAPADLFLSADRANVDRLVAGGLATDDPVTFAGNELVVIVPIGNPARLATPADLGRPGVTVIAAAEDVPISRYAAEMLRNLAKEPGYPADLEGRYERNIASREDNVAGIVTKIELGEGDAGLVYVTDTAPPAAVEIVPIPERANVRVDYVGAVVSASSNGDAAAALLDWLAGPDGQAILREFGFRAPGR
jgi:molybdate transport system substrate-binding protein